ncbi:hypothetical protein DBR43_09785 [Pedobacter sp. KBW06]|uniref:hypothetical protein n=1 Tax=Pedobacter sp. KBW06 TaxID=2153359 RepID=UPI000F5B548C|nr:hypothetical protein [Pedobacter sp. KBW06]RQO75618.1 hypothetical protein DBR43_09785 [Pedobacter sp. KBW06]
MKNLFLIVLCVVFVGCSSKELDREKAFELIQKEKKYPKIYDEDIYAGDPAHARKIMATNLEKNGYITLNRKLTLIDDRPIIVFTEKSKPFLLETSAKDREHQVQRVKIADIVLGEVTGIKMLNENKSAIAEYTIQYKNITPFVEFIRGKLDQTDTVKAYFSLFDDGWRIEKKPGLEFM